MKFLFSAGKGLEAQSVRLGWQNALRSLGYTCVVWNEDEKNIFDMFDEFQPNFFVIFGEDLDRAHLKAIAESHKKAECQCIPIIFATHRDNVDEKEKYLLEKFVEKKLLTHLFSVDFQNHAKLWEECLGVPTLSCLPALDLIRYKQSVIDNMYASDITFIGQYENKKIPFACEFLFPLSNQGLKVKIFGYGDWPIANYLGSISNYDIFSKIVFNSRINLSFSYPESKTFSERIFKIIGCHGFPLAHVLNENHLNLLKELEIPYFRDGKELVSKLILFLHHDQYSREQIKNLVYKKAIEKHTYLHRIEQVLSLFDINIKDAVHEKIRDSSK